MPDYSYSPFLVLDVTTGARSILAECKATDPATGNPVILKNLNGSTLGSTFRSGTDAMSPPFIAPIPEVTITGGGVSIRVGSFKGVLDQALAAAASAAAAQQDGLAGGTVNGAGSLVLTKRDGSVINAGTVVGPPGAPGSKQQVIDGLIAAGLRPVVNLITNPSAESGLGGWTATGATLSTSTTWAKFGSTSFRLDSTITASDIRAGSTTTIPFGMVPGRQYTLSAYGQLDAAQTGTPDIRARRVLILYQTPTSGGWVWSYGNQIANQAGEDRSVVTVTLPPTTNAAMIMFGGGATNTPVRWDGLMLEEGPTASPYVDGSLPNAYWTGAVHGSTSVGVVATVSRSSLPGTVAPVYFNNGTGAAVLLAYESGVRSMVASLQNGWVAADLALSRSGNVVTLNARGLSGAAMTSGLAIVLPPGFRPARNEDSGAWTNASTGYGPLIAYTNGELWINGATTAHTNIRFKLVFITQDTPQATLPGV